MSKIRLFRFSLVVLGLLFALFLTPVHAAPQVTRVVLPNQFHGVLVESHSNPMVEVCLYIRAGSVMDPQGQEGTAYMLGWLINEGAGQQDSTQFQQAMDNYGITLNGTASRDYLKVTMRALSKDMVYAFELLGAAINQPRLDQEPIERAKREMVASFEQNREDADVRVEERLEALLLGQHPYGRRVEGDPESITKISREGLRRFHAQAMRGPNMVLSVAGDMRPEQFMALVHQHFGGLSADPGPFGATIPTVASPVPQPWQVEHVEMDKAQSVIAVGWPGPNRQHPDYYAITVLDHILGGSGFGSRLTERLREEQGLTYSVYSYFSPWEGQGIWQVAMATKPENVPHAVSEIRTILSQLAKDGVQEDALKRAKENLLGGFPIALDTLGKLASTWGLIGYYKRGWDYLDQWPKRIERVTQEDIQRVARSFFQEPKMRVVTAGRATP
ncbi:peptidase M16 domain protein [Magnetococcus marinus MC-1]|uniref:Peptidase M16 domain protein n=1 Tax=Magnetococcus marinus (strain ATCC BAA-1437 / JCM 17883 / MC-1) TaxID=156889 RepID=A0L9K1_MAGMM|nr:pitrilysin family protein [Magnetococcus marinus]ABK44644.1 peptidase M16 domain protein [Magnetococcus marinus MC-1]